MARVLVVGDTHGEDTPLNIARKNIDNVDHVVFVGDYCDSFTSQWLPKQKAVLSSIIDFYKEYSDKVHLLVGNHDFQYMGGIQKCSGCQFGAIPNIVTFFRKNIQYFDILFKCDNWIFSHAGISQFWYNNKFGSDNNIIDNKTSPWESIDDINLAFHGGMTNCFEPLGNDIYGNDIRESPLWIRPNALLNNMLSGYNQVVGHTELTSNDRIFVDKRSGEHKLVVVDSVDRNVYAIVDTTADTCQILVD